MLKELAGIHKVVLVCGRTDMRRGIDGLAAVIRLNCGMDPLEEGTMYIFCGIKKDRFKGLIYEDTGYVLCYKRLTSGRFQWPKSREEAREISREEYIRLLEGFSIERTIKK